MEDKFTNMLNAIRVFRLSDKLENYKDDVDYELFCKYLTNLYYEMVALDTIDKVVSDDE